MSSNSMSKADATALRDRLNAMKAMRQRVEVNLHLCFAKRSRSTAILADLGMCRAIRADGYRGRGNCWRKSMGMRNDLWKSNTGRGRA